jgi:hypothetical protein
MTDITPEAVAKGLVNQIDESEPVIAGQECVIEFTEAAGAELSFTVTDESRAQHHYIAAVRSTVTQAPEHVLRRLDAVLRLNSSDVAVEKCRAIIAEALAGQS